jgi:large-conductance mechanosensitive channel
VLFTIVAFLLFVIVTLTMKSVKSAKKEISEVRDTGFAVLKVSPLLV